MRHGIRTFSHGLLKNGDYVMDEYINREAFLKWAREFYPNDKVFASAIINAPTADAAPVVRSRWRYCGFLLECQSCGEIYSRHGGDAGKLWNFCPNCGAKMDGGDGDAAD